MSPPSARPTVDAHAHVWDLDTGPPLRPTLPGVLIPDATAPLGDLIRDMDRAGVDRTVLVQASAHGWDNSHLAEMVAAHPEKLHGVALVDPFDPAGPEALALWTEEHKLQGLRINAIHYPTGELEAACRRCGVC